MDWLRALDSSVLPAFQRRARSSGWAVSLGLTCLIALSGCAPLQVRMGRKVYIDKTPIASIQASLPKGPGIAPGEKSPLVVAFTAPDGSVLATEGEGRGKVLWKDLKVETSLVTANQKGTVSLPTDPRISEGKVGHVTITVPSHPDLHSEIDIPVRYDYGYSASFSGSSGSSGFSGSNGTDGMSGSSGSFDLKNPTAGGNGTDGGHGTDGQTGGSGGDGPPVQVRVALKPVGAGASGHPLLQVRVSAQGGDQLYLVDPQGGSLTVKSEGGSGGSGGSGGKGGHGGSGGVGSPNGRSGSDGSNGSDGRRGSSGRGGRITVTYDPAAQPFLSAIHVLSPSGPAPVFQEEAVAPLW